MDSATAHSDEALLIHIAKSICEHPEDVRVERSIDEQGVLLQLFVHKEDAGKVIGKAGKTADAIRLILRVEGMKHGSRVSMKIPEPAVPHTHQPEVETTPA